MFWFGTWVWELNLVGCCTYNLLGKGCNRMQSLYQENSNLTKDSLLKAKGNSTIYQRHRLCRLTYREVANVLCKIMQPCKPRTRICLLLCRPTFFHVKVGLRLRLLFSNASHFEIQQQDTWCSPFPYLPRHMAIASENWEFTVLVGRIKYIVIMFYWPSTCLQVRDISSIYYCRIPS